MNPSPGFSYLLHVFVMGGLLSVPHPSAGQTALDASVLRSLRAKPEAEIELAVKEWAAQQIALHGRAQTAAFLAALVVKSPALADDSPSIRRFGKQVQPEFTEAVLNEINRTENPLTRGDLLQLLRTSSPDCLPSLAAWLHDPRPAEDLQEKSKRNPKIREAIADGAIPFRVCDVTFNVMQEIQSPQDPKTQRLTRSQSLESRDAQIKKGAPGGIK